MQTFSFEIFSTQMNKFSKVIKKLRFVLLRKGVYRIFYVEESLLLLATLLLYWNLILWSFNYHFNDLFNNFLNWYLHNLFNDFLNWYLHNLFNNFLNYNFNNSFNWHLNNFLHFNNSFELNWSIDRDLHRYFPHDVILVLSWGYNSFYLVFRIVCLFCYIFFPL